MLGKGTYKAELKDSTVLVVRRFKELGVTKQKFKQQMEIVGSIRHENVAPLRAYYCSKDEKLMLYDYYNYGSVSAMLHSVPPDEKIPGYRALEMTNASKVSQASDVYSYGVLLLELLTGKSQVYSTSGDKAYYKENRERGHLSGVGDPDSHTYHLVRWVNSVIREEWTVEVFDIVLFRYLKIEVEMVELLQIAMACTERVVEQRPKMTDVVEIMEDIQRD
ncbi:hypothetical protein LguiB_026763 [Lonicera macranthoides]